MDVDIIQTVIDYKLFDNLGTRDLVDLKQQNFDGANLSYELMKAIIKEGARRKKEKMGLFRRVVNLFKFKSRDMAN